MNPWLKLIENVTLDKLRSFVEFYSNTEEFSLSSTEFWLDLDEV